MKLLILITMVTWSFGSPLPSPSYQIVNSQEEAAIIEWQHKRDSLGITEPDRKRYVLKEVDFTAGTIKDVPIPTIMFGIVPVIDQVDQKPDLNVGVK